MRRTQCVLALVVMFVGLAQSWDIAVTVGDQLEFYTNGVKTNTVLLPSQNLTALAYDAVHNTLIYVNKQRDNDAICRYSINLMEHECYIERSGGNIQGLAFDPITEILFFTDTNERSINWMSFKTGSKNNVSGNLLIKMADEVPTDIAVDICRGYIYWINTNPLTSRIERARFNGSGREVFINTTYNRDLHSLVIGQQEQKIYWFMSESNLLAHLYRADLNGKNKKSLIEYTLEPSGRTIVLMKHPNALTISKESIFMVGWCSTCGLKSVWKFPKAGIRSHNCSSFFKVNTENHVGIAAKYKISEYIQGVQDCEALTNLIPNENEMSDDSFQFAKEYAEPFCDHGVKVSGKSFCKCTPGYIGERCDVSVCGNYCFQGNCSINEGGLPKCRCRAGYAGERCEVDVCHGYCLNNGTCSLNKEDEPVCQCIEDYVGDRCDVTVGLNNGDCSLKDSSTADQNDKFLDDLFANW